MKTNLKSRLDRLEKRIAKKEEIGFPSLVVIGIRDRTDNEITGISCDDKNIERQPGEAVDEMIARAEEKFQHGFAIIIYVDTEHVGDA